MCPIQLLIVEKHQYIFSCSRHLYIKQNRTFLITNLSNVNTKSWLRNQTRLYIHLLALLIPSHWYVVFGVPCFLLQPTLIFRRALIYWRWKWNIPNVTLEWFKHSSEWKFNLSPPLLLFWWLVSFLSNKNERPFILC